MLLVVPSNAGRKTRTTERERGRLRTIQDTANHVIVFLIHTINKHGALVHVSNGLCLKENANRAMWILSAKKNTTKIKK